MKEREKESELYFSASYRALWLVVVVVMLITGVLSAEPFLERFLAVPID